MPSLIKSSTLDKILVKQMAAIEPNPKQRKPRHDIFKTRVLRCAYRFPLEIVYSNRADLVPLADYKSKDLTTYKSAYQRTFHIVWNHLTDSGIFDKEPNDRNFVDLLCLHFPETKVRPVADMVGLGDQCAHLYQLKKKTSIAAFKQIARDNTMLIPILKAFKLAASSPSNDCRLPRMKKMLDHILLELLV